MEVMPANLYDIYAASHRFHIKLRHYGRGQLYLRKVPYYFIDWRLFVYNSVIYIWGGFQNNMYFKRYISFIHILAAKKRRRISTYGDPSKIKDRNQ